MILSLEKNTQCCFKCRSISKRKASHGSWSCDRSCHLYLEKPGEQTRVGSGDADLWSQKVLLKNTTEQATEDMKKASISGENTRTQSVINAVLFAVPSVQCITQHCTVFRGLFFKWFSWNQFGLMKHEETNNYILTLRTVYKGNIRYQGTIIAAMQVSEGSPKHSTHKQDVFKSTKGLKYIRAQKHCNMMI